MGTKGSDRFLSRWLERGSPALAAAGLGVALTAMPGVFPGGTAQGADAEACAAGVADFNGDGCGDLMVADPDATVAGQSRAGRVNVRYGTGSGSPGTWAVLTQGQQGIDGVPESGDRFGTLVRAVRINGDSFVDLLVASPAEDVGGAQDAGIIQVIFGSVDGLGAGRGSLTLRQGLHGVPGMPEAGDQFGGSFVVNTTTGGFWEPVPAVAYGAPGEDVGGAIDAGTAGLVIFDRATGDVTAAGAISQDSPGISGRAEAGDRFGAAVEMFQGPNGFGCPTDGLRGYVLAVGTPGEDLGTVPDAGMIHMVRDLSSDVTLSQDSAGVSGVAEPGDRFGTSLTLTSYCDHDGGSQSTLGVGVPHEDIGPATDAGAAYLFHIFEYQVSPSQQWSVSQDTDGVAGTAEAGDRFGAVVAVDPYWRDGIGEPVVVSAPGEDLGAAADAGSVQVFGSLGATPGDGDVFVSQAIAEELPEAGDRFGIALLMKADYLYIGAPDDASYPTGIVHGIAWSTLAGTPAPPVRFVPGLDGVPVGAARFGVSLA